MLPINIYPYLDINDLNLDYILKTIKSLNEKLSNFVALNTIKYANPIQWNITTQYEMNTVVIDPISGTAYLSVAPVPAGVALTNSDYWTPIFTLNLLSANQNITLRDDANNVISTFSSDIGDWLIWNYTLYKVIRPINVNEAYVVGYNLERFSVELFIREYVNNILDMIGDLTDLDTTDKTDIVSAINEVLSDLSTTIGDLNDLNTTDKTNIVNAINELLFRLNSANGLFVDMAVNANDYSEGDIITTGGYDTFGVGAASYMIHNSSESYYIPFGAKYAELLYSNTINIDALGALHGLSNPDNSPILETAIALAFHNYPLASISAGYFEGGATIEFGPFKYRFTSKIELQNSGSLKFKGCGHNTELAYDGAGYLFTFTATGSHWSDNIHFSDLTFVGLGGAINIDKAAFCSFDNLLVLTSGSGGIIISNGVGNTFERCTFSGMNYGLQILTDTTTTSINECNFRFCKSTGLSITDSNDTNCTNCIFEYGTSGSYGFVVQTGSTHINFENCWIEGNPCLINNSDVILHSIVTGEGTQNIPSVITFNSDNGKHTIYADDIKRNKTGEVNGLKLQTTSIANVGGCIRYCNAPAPFLDFDNRHISIPGDRVQLNQYVTASCGIIEVHSGTASYLGVYEYNGLTTTLTKLGGTLGTPTIGQDTGYIYWTTAPADAIIDVYF